MKVLVYFKQEFFSKKREGTDSNLRYPIRVEEFVSKVFDVQSTKELLKKFQSFNYIPEHIKDELGHNSEIIIKKKNMIWYLPENFKPYF